jgi:hypothetical protein
MGRETSGIVTWRGIAAEAKVLLESAELILRGGHNGRFPREELTNVRGAADGLTFSAAGGLLHVALPEAEAMRWANAIQTPPPSLATKLGIGPEKLAWVQGEVSEPALAVALIGVTTESVANAAVSIVMIESHSDLVRALAGGEERGLPVWCVYPKGKAANPGDAAIRTAFRADGWIDNKTCAVSARLTATRYARKK